jgi:O-antigen ligase
MRFAQSLNPKPLWIFAAIASGVLIVLLPVQYAAGLLVGGVILALALWEPMLGLGVALTFGPSRAYLAAQGYFGPQYDLGQIFFGLAACGWLARGALRREVVFPRLGVYGPLAVYIFIGALSLYNAREWQNGLNELIKWTEVGVVIAMVYTEAQRGKLHWAVGAVLLTGVLQAGLGVWQYRFWEDGPEGFRLPGGYFRAYGTFEQPNPYAGFLGLIWPVAAGLALGQLPKAEAWLKHRFPTFPLRTFYFLLPTSFFLFLAALYLTGLYISFSRGAWLGAGVAALVILIFWPRRLSVGVGLVGAALVGGWVLLQAGLLPAGVASRLTSVTDFVNVSDVRGVNINDLNFALVERLAHWQAAQGMIEAHSWLGVGLGNFSSAYPEYSLLRWPTNRGHAHNIYLHTWAETGLLGLFAYVSFWAYVIILTVWTIRRTSGWQRGLALGLLGVWAHLLTHHLVDNLHVNNNDLLLAAQIGLLHAIIPNRNRARD